jgi:predicted dehydrogenase
MVEDKLGTLIIGGGGVSQSYLDYFQGNESAPLVAVADPNPDIQEHVRKTYPGTEVIADYRELLGRDDIDLVVVCTPHNLHHSMVTRSLKAGKHVICEKPIAISVAEADDMIECAEKCGRKLFVGLNMRYDPRHQTIARALKENVLGRVFLARTSYMGYEVKRFADPDNWKGDLERAGGGVLLDGGYHVVDLLNMLFGRAKSVQACGGRLVIETEGKGEDNVLLQIEFESGVVASLYASFTVRNAGCDDEPTLGLQLDLFGTKASLYSSYDSPTRHVELNIKGHEETRDLDVVPVPEIKTDFIESIRTGSDTLVTAVDARNALAVVEAAYASLRDGGRVAVNWRD